MGRKTKIDKRRRPKRLVGAVEKSPDAQGGTTEDQPSPGPQSRRTFLWKAWLGLAAVAVAEMVWVALGFLRPKAPVEEEDARVVTAGPVDAFQPGSVTAFPQGRFYLARLDAGGFLALSRECTHLGCTVPWNQEEHHFVCPCHSSTFDINGEVVNPPAPRALDLFEVRIENRVVKVNTANVMRRNAFHRNQVTVP